MHRVETGLYVGAAADAAAHDRLRDAGVETIVSLTHGEPEGTPHWLDRRAFPMRDGPQNEYATFRAASEALLDALAGGDTVLVHCSAGSSRSVAVAAAALSVYAEIPIERALARIESRRPQAGPHPSLVSRAERFVAERNRVVGTDSEGADSP